LTRTSGPHSRAKIQDMELTKTKEAPS